MANPFIGEIRLFAGNFAPINWQFCDGSLVPISEFEALFNLIGTTYGGDGQNTFALPDLRGRVPVHQGNFNGSNAVIGQISGSETVTLNTNQMASHTHQLIGSTATATLGTPGGSALAVTPGNSYGPGPATSPMSALAVGVQGGAQGGAQAHDNMAPYQAMNYIISLFGIFPSQG